MNAEEILTALGVATLTPSDEMVEEIQEAICDAFCLAERAAFPEAVAFLAMLDDA